MEHYAAFKCRVTDAMGGFQQTRWRVEDISVNEFKFPFSDRMSKLFLKEWNRAIVF